MTLVAKLYSSQGVAIQTLNPSKVTLARRVGDIGEGIITVSSSEIPYSSLVRDMIITIERSVLGGNMFLEGQTVWFLRGKKLSMNKEGDTYDLYVQDNISLLRRRIIAYFASEAETDKIDPADDMMKAIVRENFGTSAIAARDISDILSVQSDVSAGPILEREFAWRYVLPTLKEIALASEQAGTAILFDVVSTQVQSYVPNEPPFTFEFQTFKETRGLDRRFPSGSNPLLIGPDYLNMESAEIEDDWRDEETHLYAGGEGDDLLRLIEEVESDLVNQSAIGRVEGWFDAPDLDVSQDLIDAANGELFRRIGRTKIRGNLAGDLKNRWGVAVGYGDFVTAQVRGHSVDCRLNAYQFDYDRETGFDVKVVLEGEGS